jgi:hypothetical protein
LRHTLESFFQAPRSIPKLPRGPFRSRFDKNAKKKLMDVPFGRDVFKSMQREEKAFRKQRVATCEREVCRKFETEGSDKFMVCKACKEQLDRRVFYCSV